MPEISRFYGIKIKMYYKDHNPPHFHAEYQDYEVLINIQTGEVAGKISRRALKLIYEWLDEHESELLENWERSKSHVKLYSIEPLQ